MMEKDKRAHLRTKEEYHEKLRSMRPNLYIDGELVDRFDERLRPAINVIDATYDLTHLPEYDGLVTAKSHLDGATINRFTHIHQSSDDLLKKQEMTRLYCRKVGGCIQRCMGIDGMNALSVVTHEVDQACGTEYHARFLEYLRHFQENDVVACCAQTDVKGDRSKRPHEQVDPDLYLRIVEKRKDGIVVRGAKAHNTAAPYVEEIIVVPTRLLTPEEGDWAVAFAVPADASGVMLVTRPSAPRARKHLATPGPFGSADSLTVFDDVFVPWERVFLCGETMFGGRLALLFATYHRHSYTGCKPAVSDIMMGLSALVAEYNGLGKASHVRDKLADLIAVAELVYAAGIAASVKAHRASSGTYIPEPMYANVGRYHAGVNIYHEFEILTDLAGGLSATLPLEGDFSSEQTAEVLAKYIMRNPDISPEKQHRCFRLISDIVCSAHGGLSQVAGLHGGGSPIMEKIAITGLYDLESRKQIAKYLAGIED